MSHIWTFSPSSEAHLQRCIAAAAPQNSNNKWALAFGKKSVKSDNSDDIAVVENEEVMQEVSVVAFDAAEEQKPVILTLNNDDNFFDMIESDPITRLDCLVEECLKNQDLFTIIANRLSGSTIEKICNILFEKNNVNTAFLNDFYQKFFPAYLKREYTWFSLDLLVKCNKTYPVQFKKLLGILLKDLDIPNKVLQDYVQSLNEEEKLSFINCLTEIELNTKEFIHNLFTIYSVYRDCIKTDHIQTYIFYNLMKNSPECVSERNYGRLLLAYLQAQKGIGPVNDCKKLENLIEMHRSPFKKPCLNVFKEVLEKFHS